MSFLWAIIVITLYDGLIFSLSNITNMNFETIFRGVNSFLKLGGGGQVVMRRAAASLVAPSIIPKSGPAPLLLTPLILLTKK